MPGAYDALDAWLSNIGRSRHMSAKNFQLFSAFCGTICSIMFALAFIIPGFLPPIRAYWSADETAYWYQHHVKRVHAGSAILTLSGMFYMPYSACISAQMRRIPNLHYIVPTLQLACAAAGLWTFMLPGVLLGVVGFRPHRPAEITQALNELFWICALIPWPTFFVQDLAFAYAILIDNRKKPLFPKWVAIVNIVLPICLVPALGIHTTDHGPMAWHSVFPFWLPGITFCGQLIFDSFCLISAIRNSPEQGEMIVDMFPGPGTSKILNEGSGHVEVGDLENGHRSD